MTMKLEGVWFVIASNFPMWTKGNRTRPRFIYSNVRTIAGRTVMDDTVAYVQKGREKTIIGVDTQDSGVPTRFEWRGKGFLKLLTSRWEIVSVSADEQLIALAFHKTLVTPAGIDIISRTEQVSEAAYAAILAAIGTPSLKRL
jgi:hypothetical protein